MSTTAPSSSARILALIYPQTYQRALKLVEDLDDEQLARTPNATTTSLAWNLWHLARFADRAQANLARWSPALRKEGETIAELWDAENLASKWGWPAASLGWHDTGMEMGLEGAHDLPMPPKAVLLQYAERAFAAATQRVGQLDDEILAVSYVSELEPDRPVIESAVLTWLSHNERHLGMMECLRGVLGLVGSATV